MFLAYDWTEQVFEQPLAHFDIKVRITKPYLTSIKIAIYVKSKRIGMAIVEINLPSGYEYEDEKEMYNYLNHKGKTVNVKVGLVLNI
jgi:hypothetical protein